jgi:hypothetical protein
MIPLIDSQSRILTKQQYIEYLIATCKNYICTNLSDHLDGGAGTSVVAQQNTDSHGIACYN